MASYIYINKYIYVYVVNYIPIIKLATYHNPIDDSVICFPYIGNVIIPTDELHHWFFRGVSSNHQPALKKTMKSQFYTIFLWTAGGHHGLGIISPFISPFVCFFVAGKIHNISLGFTCLDQPRLSSKGQADPGLGFSMSSLRYSKCSPDFPMTVSGYKPSFLEDVQ